MQYSLLIDQSRSIEWGLNLSEATLFCVVVSAPMWATQVIRGGQVWHWIANAKLASELPLLSSKPDTIKRLLASLQKKGLINRTTDGRKTYVQITDKGRQWNSKAGREINPPQGGKNIPTKAGNISRQSVNHISDNQDHTPLPPEGDGAQAINQDRTPKDKRATPQQVADAYNEVLGSKLPRCVTLNSKRNRAIKVFLDNLKAPTEKAVIAYLRRFLKVARPFHFGENDRHWRATFDFVIKPDTVIKVREESL